ncbi:outer membrane receptor protein involved in Fe transport [Winogradskyella eximia]|uniref:Outer membrane receptor protein involved in Fe transport n=1 Tax=Winogradskyella eximia TaxID=262006 RepID=A0A3D9HCY9_9FLAO|nr:outer membrane beta-barrel protein [Winogradskyella eximia]RED47310.1 outer membrane receptor protein involved in Fe transport [Winogradskyella eximia]
MNKLVLVFAFLFAINSFSQEKKFEIKGTLIAEDTKKPLESATIYLERVKDSSVVTYTISDKNGNFKIESSTYDKSLNFYVSYIGYATYFKKINIDKENIDLKAISLELDNQLGEVLVKSTAPITIKKDTLEFNVKSFKTKKDANVEDLLKQLPGVEVDEEGKITVNGKSVNKILVNGKPFFGDDPTITTKNLTKDIIEKIQIVDTKTKSEEFTGEEGDKENKTINLTIKEENNKGVFGRVSAGGGTDKRYELAGMVNVFDNDRRVSVLAGANNTNTPGFSFGEISKMFGNGGGVSFNSNGSFSIGGRSFGGGEGITTSQNAGLNYADVIGEKTDLSADYFFSSSNSENKSSSQRETILSDSRFFTNSNSKSDNDTDNHSFNLEFEIKTDSTFQISIEPSFGYSKSRTRYNSNEETLDENLLLTNQSEVNSDVESFARRFSNEISITKRFGNRGAFIKAELETTVNQQESDDFLDSATEVYGTNPETIDRNQFAEGENNSYGVSTALSYRLPLITKKFFLNFKYKYARDKDNNRESTFDYNNSTQDFTDFNTDLSTDFQYTDYRSIPGFGLSYRGEKFSTSFDIGYNIRTLKNEDLLRPQFNVERDFKNIEANSYISYTFSPKASIYVNYWLENQPPALRQLQAFEDVSNPLQTIIGNPNLEPSNNHSFYAGYNGFDWQKRTGFYVGVNASISDNQVVSKTFVDLETLKRTTTYVNVDGNYNIGSWVNYNKDFKVDTLRTIKLKVRASYNTSERINFNNDVKYASKINRISPRIGLDFIWDKVLEFKPYYQLSFTNNAYDIAAFEDREFTSHNAGVRTATFLPKNLEWRNDINFNYNPNVADGFQKSAWFWNSTLAYSVFNDKAIITLKVYDLLNQNTNARRIATQDYIEDKQSTVLRQYFMVSLSYKFNSLGSKGESGGDDVYFFD